MLQAHTKHLLTWFGNREHGRQNMKTNKMKNIAFILIQILSSPFFTFRISYLLIVHLRAQRLRSRCGKSKSLNEGERNWKLNRSISWIKYLPFCSFEVSSNLPWGRLMNAQCFKEISDIRTTLLISSYYSVQSSSILEIVEGWFDSHWNSKYQVHLLFISWNGIL